MNWKAHPERGSELALRFIAWLAQAAGRSFCRLLIYPIVLYFMFTSRPARRASYEFLQAVNGRRARFHEVFKHLYSFGVTLLDRVYLASAGVSNLDLIIEDRRLIDDVLVKGKGCVLLGSHLGSFDLMALARHGINDRPLSIMMRVDPAARLRRIAGIDDSAWKVIPQGTPHSLLLAHEALSRGEIVAILADRTEGRSAVPALFMGRPARLPKAPYLLAARSNAPLLACFGLYEGRNRYRIKFVDPEIALPPDSSAEQIAHAVQLYAGVLEEYARRYPFNWFNFYPYWD
jgi:predicted LPLAT superfamily acyltransferase